MRKKFFALFVSFAVFLPSSAAMAMTVIAFGDSITAGAPGFRSALEIPPAGQGNPESQYGYWLNKIFPEWTILNKGVSGQRTDQLLKRFERDVLAEKPDKVIIMAGVNDLYQGYEVDEITSNLEKIYKKALAAGIQVMACTIAPYDEADSRVLSRMKQVNAWIREYAEKNEILFCDTYLAAESPVRPGKLAGSPDGLHPDVDTYRKIGEAIALVFRHNEKEMEAES